MFTTIEYNHTWTPLFLERKDEENSLKMLPVSIFGFDTWGDFISYFLPK